MLNTATFFLTAEVQNDSPSCEMKTVIQWHIMKVLHTCEAHSFVSMHKLIFIQDSGVRYIPVPLSY